MICKSCGSAITYQVHICPYCRYIFSISERSDIIAEFERSPQTDESISKYQIAIPWREYEIELDTLWSKPLVIILLSWISYYQRYWSQRLSKRCVFNPTCSQYAKLALMKHGLIRGSIKTFTRLMRCHPGNEGIDLP